MPFTFYKYQGTGNDFVIIDNRDLKFDRKNNSLVAKLCDRRFGIGADGLMLLQGKQGFDFEMVYYNSDGNESSMCGNGGRCIVEFARHLGLIRDKAHFIAIDGVHVAIAKPGFISLKMNDVKNVELNADFSFLNTGSPHYVAFVNDIRNFNVFEEGKKIRNNDRFQPGGTNVNFVEKEYNNLFVRTFERGVENETYSCGTGVTAAALVASLKNVSTADNYCSVKTLGGELNVKFLKHPDNSFTDIWLEGPANFVFKGEIDV
ncbi:MAG TPA: diaminopimelate epimerase [Bacteroidia bacterium]|jgi:diaminopimelate epimerase|nr:diaminopimelate epimerase [Bacteroidia bacterium]